MEIFEYDAAHKYYIEKHREFLRQERQIEIWKSGRETIVEKETKKEKKNLYHSR